MAWRACIPRVAEARDDRFIAAVDVRGRQRFTLAYIVRAVTPGNYTAPGAVIEDMYRPGVFARTDVSTICDWRGRLIMGERKRRFLKRALAPLILGMALVAVLDRVFPPPLERAAAFAPIVTDRHGVWLHAFANDEGRWRFRADLSAIDPVFIDRLIRIEDKRFWRHPGVDPIAIVRAGGSLIRSGEIVSGRVNDYHANGAVA